MKHRVKIVCAIVTIALATSHGALAQSGDRGKSESGSEARQAAEERAKETAAPADASKAREKAAEAKAPEAPKPAGDARETAADKRREAPAKAQQGQGQTQRGAAMERQAAQFETIHARRMAQLQRLRDLAVENDRQDMVSRVDGLITRELEQHSRQKERLQKRAGKAGAPESPAPEAEEK